MLEYFVVQTFSVGRQHEMQADEPILAKSLEHSLVIAQALTEKKVGVVAFSRSGDPSIGEYEDAIIHFRYGQTPFEDDSIALAS